MTKQLYIMEYLPVGYIDLYIPGEDGEPNVIDHNAPEDEEVDDDTYGGEVDQEYVPDYSLF